MTFAKNWEPWHTCEVFPHSAVMVEPALATTQTATIPLGTPVHTTLPTISPPAVPIHPPTDPPVTTLPQTPPHTTAEWGDLAIRGLFERGTNAIVDVCITNLDSSTSRARGPLKVLQQHEADKRRKYHAICASRRESFHPFVASADGLLAPAATQLLQRLAALTADRQQKPYSIVMQHLRLRIAITLVKAVNHCLR